MKKLLSFYFSRTGNSKFMAEKLAGELHCDVACIKPMFKALLWLFLISLMKLRIPIHISEYKTQDYDEIILFGPVWGGLLITPLRSAIHQCIKAKKKFHFAVTCESKEEDKNSEYGYNHVFGMVDTCSGKWVLEKAAFSSTLVKDYSDEGRDVTSEKVVSFRGQLYGCRHGNLSL